MAVDSARILARWPHFVEAPAGTLQEALNAAQVRVSAYYWGDRRDEGVMLLAAHLLCIDPGGQFARLVAKDGSTTYGTAYEQMSAEIPIGDRVI